MKIFKKRRDHAKSSSVDLSTDTSLNERAPPSKRANRTPGESPSEEEEPCDGSVQRDPLFYHTPLVLLVERTLFKVPRAYFENHSEVFRINYLLCVLQPEGEGVPDGLTDQQPLRLEGVDAAEFGCLLKAMIQEDLTGDVEMSWMEWTSVLKLALMWQMKHIQDLALQRIPSKVQTSDEWIAALKISTKLRIRELRAIAIQELASNLSTLKKVELGVECSVEPWLREAYTAFVTRTEVISVADEDQLGRRRTSDLFRVRHRRMEEGSTSFVKKDIQITFQSEFADIAAFDHSPISFLQANLQTATDPVALRKDETYYFADVIFLVENILFKISRYLFEQTSDVFRGMFSLPAVEGEVLDGSSDEQPLRLEGIRPADFRQLLKAMKVPPSTNSRSKSTKLQQFPCSSSHDKPILWSEWASILELSCMWQMPKIREMAIQTILAHRQEINPADWKILLKLSAKLAVTEIRDPAIQNLSGILQPMERIELGIECRVSLWLLEGLKGLVQARGGISAADEERLGRKMMSKLFRVRDQYLQRIQHHDDDTYVVDEIQKMFADELKEAGWMEN